MLMTAHPSRDLRIRDPFCFGACMELGMERTMAQMEQVRRRLWGHIVEVEAA